VLTIIETSFVGSPTIAPRPIHRIGPAADSAVGRSTEPPGGWVGGSAEVREWRRRYRAPVGSPLRPPPIDAALAIALVLGGISEAFATETTRAPAVHALVSVLVMGALAWRRRFPLSVLALSVAGVFALDPVNQLSTFIALVIASYTTGAHLDPPRAWVGLGVAVAPFWVAFAATGGVPSDFVVPAVLYGGPWVVGRLSRERGRRVDELADRAARLEREQDEQQAAAVAAERARIACELHDIVSHSISVIAVQTQAVRRRLNPAQTREADDLRAVETTARQAMAEMRRLFGVLRADGERPSLAPQPGLDQLGGLARRDPCGGPFHRRACRGRPRAAAARCRPRCVPNRAGGTDERAQARRRCPRRGHALFW